MDAYWRRETLKKRNPSYEYEETHALGIRAYTDQNVLRTKTPFSRDEMREQVSDFLGEARKLGSEASGKRPEYLGGYQLLLQQTARHAEAFSEAIISLPMFSYEELLETMGLSFQVMESTNSMGQVFWAGIGNGVDGRAFPDFAEVIMRKADMLYFDERSNSYLDDGWEVILSQKTKSGTTIGFCKGTNWLRLNNSLKTLQDPSLTSGELCHPMTLPVIIFSYEIASRLEVAQRNAKAGLEIIKRKIGQVQSHEQRGNDPVAFIEDLNQRIADCHADILWKRPQRYLDIANDIHEALKLYFDNISDEKREILRTSHTVLVARITFFQAKLKSITNAAFRNEADLTLQRESLQGIIAIDVARRQEEAKAKRSEEMNAQKMARDDEKKRVKEQDDRAKNLQTLFSVLGIGFLPGIFIATVFSTTFFDFRDEWSVTGNFWIYWAVALPFTGLILAIWLVARRSEGRESRKALPVPM